MIKLLKRYSKIIRTYRITKYEQFGANLRLRLEIEFTDNSKLFVRETIIEGKKRVYAYHWQNENSQLIIRWDNAPDWDVETFPHHKHVNDEVLPSFEHTLEQILKEIETHLKVK